MSEIDPNIRENIEFTYLCCYKSRAMMYAGVSCRPQPHFPASGRKELALRIPRQLRVPPRLVALQAPESSTNSALKSETVGMR
jgi:hypothetical protein